MSANEALNALSTTHASNTPAGGDNIGTTLDDELRSNKGNIASAARWEVTATITAASTIPVTAMHKLVPCDGSAGGTVTLTLPTVANAGNGFDVDFIKIGAVNKVIIDGNGSEAVNGGTAVTLSAAYGRVRLACNGTKWFANHGAGESFTDSLAGSANRTNYGFEFTNGSTPDDEVDIAAGQCWDTTKTYLIIGTAMTKLVTALWAVGTAAGSWDVGTSPANEGCYWYAIRKDSDASVDYVCSLSETWAGVTKTRLSGYTYGQKLMYTVFNGTNDLTGFTQYGDTVVTDSPKTIVASDAIVSSNIFQDYINVYAPAYSLATMVIYGADGTSGSGAMQISLATFDSGKDGAGAGTGHAVNYVLASSSVIAALIAPGRIPLNGDRKFLATASESVACTLYLYANQFTMTDRFNSAS